MSDHGSIPPLPFMEGLPKEELDDFDQAVDSSLLGKAVSDQALMESLEGLKSGGGKNDDFLDQTLPGTSGNKNKPTFESRGSDEEDQEGSQSGSDSSAETSANESPKNRKDGKKAKKSSKTYTLKLNNWDPIAHMMKLDPKKISEAEEEFVGMDHVRFNSVSSSPEKDLALYKIRLYNNIVTHRDIIPSLVQQKFVTCIKEADYQDPSLEGMITGAILSAENMDQMKVRDLFRAIEGAEKRMLKMVSLCEDSMRAVIDQQQKQAQILNKFSALASQLQSSHDQIILTIGQQKARPQSIASSSATQENVQLPEKKKKKESVTYYKSLSSKLTWSDDQGKAIKISITPSKAENQELAKHYEKAFLKLKPETQKIWMKMEPDEAVTLLGKMGHSGPITGSAIQTAVNFLHSEGKIREGTFKIIRKK
ncbi:P [Blacklegged tick rhabdovirus 1]|uniref:P n=1 Tax=Blacklegged tick rhabdovirus 1 TaxID=2079605 RepID=A0A2K9YNG5_9RHAB|nr:P [Blacklegged tick rhabdovirus-1] [Blacklegged tick rhabdovirus-1]AUW34387.1 P [Blacklegged tick rhabdovirus-1] [Blacklegged tick rhabdovirus-1]